MPPEPSLLQSYVAGQNAPARPAPTRELTNVYDEAGNPLPIEDVGGALSEGRARFDADQKYNLLDQSGEARIVTGDQVYNALRQGWNLESTEERDLRHRKEQAGFAEGAKSAGLGLAEALSFGTAPAFAEIFGGMGAGSEWRKTTEASPGAHVAGEIAGLVSPLAVEGLAARGLSRGAVGLAAEGVTAAPRAVSRFARGAGEAVEAALPEARTALGKALTKGAKLGTEGAIEGSIYGAGYTVGEASLGDRELTAERLLAGAGTGALLGAGIGGGLGVLGSGAKSLAERGVGGLEGFAERQAWKATGATGANTKRVGLEQAKRSGRRMLDEGLVKFESFEDRAVALRKATDEAGQSIGNLINRIDETGARPSVAPIVEKLDEQLGKLREGVGADVRLAKRLDRDFGDWLRDRVTPGSEPTFKELHGMRARVDDYLEQARRGNDTVRQTELGKLRNIVEDEIKSQADALAPRVGGDFLGEYTAAKARYKDLVAAAQVAEARAPFLEAGNRSFSLTDNIMAAGAIAAGGPTGLLAAGANKLLREYGDTAAALLANKLRPKPGVPGLGLSDVVGAAPNVANDIEPNLYNRLLTGDVPEELWKFRREGMREASSEQVAKAYRGAGSPNDIATGQVVPPGSKEPLPPIQLNIDDEGQVFLRDGRHRLAEAKKAGATKIRATIQTIEDYHEKGPFDLEPVVISIPGRGGAPDASVIRSKLEALGYVKSKADAVALELSKDVKDAVTGKAHSALPKAPTGATTYEALAADAREHRAAPDRSIAKVATRVAPLLAVTPELGRSVVAKATGDLQYLSQQLPPAGTAGLTPKQAAKVVPSGSERAAFERKAEAITNTKGAIFDMKNNRLSDEAIAAIRERRPLLLDKIVEEAQTAYAELVAQGKAPPRQQRMQIEKLIGAPIDPASNPVVISVVQQVYADQAAAIAAPVTPTPQSAIKRADRMMSQSDAIARGEG